MKIGKIGFANGTITEIENIELEPGEIEAFEKLIHAMTELERSRRAATVKYVPRDRKK